MTDEKSTIHHEYATGVDSDGSGEVDIGVRTTDDEGIRNVETNSFTVAIPARGVIQITAEAEGVDLYPNQYESADEFVDLVEEFVDEHEFDVTEQGLNLFEEGGELARDILVEEEAKVNWKERDTDLEKEIGDVIFSAAGIAVLMGIDPLDAAAKVAKDNMEK